MARFTCGGTATGAGSATLPMMSLYNGAAVNAHIFEIWITNPTATACVVGLAKLTSTGTQGASITPLALDAYSAATAGCVGKQTHTVAPTLTDFMYRAALAASGGGVAWTFGGPTALTLTQGTANGWGIYCPTGTAQACTVTFVFEE